MKFIFFSNIKIHYSEVLEEPEANRLKPEADQVFEEADFSSSSSSEKDMVTKKSPHRPVSASSR